MTASHPDASVKGKAKTSGRLRLVFGFTALACVAATVCVTPTSRSRSSRLQIQFDGKNGLPADMTSQIDGRTKSWLAGPVRLTVTDTVSQKEEELTTGRVRRTDGGADAAAVLASLSIATSQRFRVAGAKADWDLSFTGSGPRTEHEILIEFPVLSLGAKIFTPSQYGIMDVAAYPSFRPVAYATYAWEDGQTYVLPIISVMDPASDSALTIALPADGNIPHLQVEWAEAKILRLRMARRGIGGGQPTPLKVLFYVHPADYRSALKAYAADFPAYFRPALPRGPYEGTFWYHHILSHPEFAEMGRQNVRYIWSSFWFTYLGDFLPEGNLWYPYSYARWWKLKEMMSDDKINAFIRTMHAHGIGTYAYFNVTEFGGAGGKTGDSVDADRVVQEKLGGALVRNEKGETIRSWEGTKVVNPGRNYSYWPLLEAQIRRHLTRLPGIDGFIVDRLDWAHSFDYGHADGLSMAGTREVENLAGPVSTAVQELCRLSHEAGKRVFVNQFWRVETIRDSDGYCHENDYLPAMGYLAPFRPASAWHMRRSYRGDWLPFEAQMKRRLQWALFPQFVAHEFDVSQQPPDPRAADLMELFAPLFEPFVGKEQILEPHCVSVTGANEANLFVNGKGQYVVPVTSRIRFLCRPPQALERAEVTIDIPDAPELRWAHIVSADAAPARAPVVIRRGKAHVILERHGSSSVLIVGKGVEPEIDGRDAERFEGLRRKLFPGVSVRGEAAGRPEIADITETILRVGGAAIGASGPSTVVDVLLDKRKVGEIKDAAGGFECPLSSAGLPERLPVVGFCPGDEGTWFVPEKVEMIAKTKRGESWCVATWEPGDPADPEGERGFKITLSWRRPAPVSETSAKNP